MTSSGTATVTLPTDEQILITREFDAPRHLVYTAWTTPELVKRWWNAKRGEVTIAEIDLRVGGRWRYVMVADGGLEVGFHGEYREIRFGRLSWPHFGRLIWPHPRPIASRPFELFGARAGGRRGDGIESGAVRTDPA